MTTSEMSASRAALEALFDAPRRAPELAPVSPDIPIPHNLDPRIEADRLLMGDGGLLYWWYAGRDAAGILHVFRFQRGASLMRWHQLLQSQRLLTVTGPYRSANVAQQRATE